MRKVRTGKYCLPTSNFGFDRQEPLKIPACNRKEGNANKGSLWKRRNFVSSFSSLWKRSNANRRTSPFTEGFEGPTVGEDNSDSLEK